MTDKVITTNKSALVKKYGATGWTKVEKAIARLVKADKARGMTTQVILLDDTGAMAAAAGAAVTTPSSALQTKRAIDAVFKTYNPDYLLILGAPDVVCHQELSNPAYVPNKDNDASVPSDLPYACEEGSSKDAARFIGPIRVIGRLPDLMGADNPKHLIKLLESAASYQSRPAQDYANYFGLSAKLWSGSTTQSLEHIFGNSSSQLLSPLAGPLYDGGELNALAHFINCHGAAAEPQFFGEDAQKNFPIAVTTRDVTGQIMEGTVAAVECCYGAELYDSATLGYDMPICQSYMDQGAYGYLGSTTISYGPADGNGAADYLCQDFLAFVLEGASLGRAMLMAQQSFVQRTGQMDPIDLKTLSQFYLLGDPSVHPVIPGNVTKVPQVTDEEEASRFTRSERREKMKQMGRFLSDTKPTASKAVPTGTLKAETANALANIAKKAGIENGSSFKAFAVKSGRSRKKEDIKATGQPTRYFLKISKPNEQPHQGVNLGVGVIAKELNGRIVGYRIYHQR